jgi:hypothetical protein
MSKTGLAHLKSLLNCWTIFFNLHFSVRKCLRQINKNTTNNNDNKTNGTETFKIETKLSNAINGPLKKMAKKPFLTST